MSLWDGSWLLKSVVGSFDMGLKAKGCWSCSPGSEKWQTFLVSCWLTHESQTVIQRENVKCLLDEQILKIKRLRKNLKNSLSYRLSKKTYLILVMMYSVFMNSPTGQNGGETPMWTLVVLLQSLAGTQGECPAAHIPGSGHWALCELSV